MLGNQNITLLLVGDLLLMLLSDRPAFELLNKKNCQEEDLEFYQKGEEIPLIDSGFWQVYRGIVQLNRFNGSEREVVVGWVTPNHAFGNDINGTSHYSAIALTDIYLRHYQPQQVALDIQLARLLLSELSYRLLKSEQMIAINSLRKVEDRLLEFLSMLKEEIGHPVAKGTRLTVRFTHQNIADSVCATRVTITRILGELQDRNLLEFDRDRYLIVKF